MESNQKYPGEFLLDFQSVDRFLYRVSDLHQLAESASRESLERLDQCHIYLLGKRPRISIVPDSIRIGWKVLRLTVEYRLDGVLHRARVEFPRSALRADEVKFAASPYPHRELISYDATGAVVGYTLLANAAHLFHKALPQARDLEIVYVGKGLRNSAQDRLENHATLQKILADIISNEPDMEVFALVYAFKYRKNILAFRGITPLIRGHAAEEHFLKAMEYKPSLDEQVSLIEAAAISYFRTEHYNTHYLDFPSRRQRLIKKVHDADIAAMMVHLDNTNIGELRIYSRHVQPSSTHSILIDFRHAEGENSFFARPGTSKGSKGGA